MPINLEELKTNQLFSLYRRVLSELERRRVTRSANNPVADYAEQLAAKTLGLRLASKSTKGYDANDEDGKRYEVKCRHLSARNPSRQLSPFRALDDYHFDFLVGIIFEPDYSVKRACLVPHAVVLQNATHRAHVNGFILHLNDNIWQLEGVKDLTYDMQMAQYEED